MARLKDGWKALELNSIMVSTISRCVFSAFGNPRSCDHLVSATPTSMLLNTRGIFRMMLLHDFGDEILFSLFEHRFSGISVNGVKATTRNCIGYCDFTHFPAAPAPIILPRKTSFKHEVVNEEEEILRSLPP